MSVANLTFKKYATEFQQRHCIPIMWQRMTEWNSSASSFSDLHIQKPFQKAQTSEI